MTVCQQTAPRVANTVATTSKVSASEWANAAALYNSCGLHKNLQRTPAQMRDKFIQICDPTKKSGHGGADFSSDQVYVFIVFILYPYSAFIPVPIHPL